MEGAEPGETSMDEKNPELEVCHLAGRTYVDDPDYNAFQDLISHSRTLIYSAEDFKPPVRFSEAQ